jgi:diguanylate cyclase (GGDEF)-like protein
MSRAGSPDAPEAALQAGAADSEAVDSCRMRGGEHMQVPVSAEGAVLHPFIELWDAFGAGVYLLFGVIHLDLWFRRRDRLGHLWLAAASASALLVDLTGIIQRRSGFEPSPVLDALNLFGVACATVSLFELVSTFRRKPTAPVARCVEAIVLALAPAAGAFATSFAPGVVAGCGVLLVWAMIRALRAARRGDGESAMVARGFMVLTLCLIGDILHELKILPVPGGLPIVGFIVLFLASARSLNERFEEEEAASRTDSLTGLLNRRGFLEAGDGALVRARRSGKPLSVVISDIDHFKAVNDAHGHAAGDAALKQLATALRSAVRAQDAVARWGGEEFILLLPDTGLAGAAKVAESLRAAVAELPMSFQGNPVGVTLSLGVAEYDPTRNFEETIGVADAALYRAKEQGRNRVSVR